MKRISGQSNGISTGTACFSVANEYHKIQAGLYRSIIHRYGIG